jgi:hypothetical protein
MTGRAHAYRLTILPLLLLLVSPLLACTNAGGGGEPGVMSAGGARGRIAQAEAAPIGPPGDRQIVRTADVGLEVGDVDAARKSAEAAVAARKGWVESVYESEDSLRLQLRVPAPQLDDFLAELSGLGKVERVSITTYDVTEEHADLGVRLANALKLRDRLQQLLDKATTVEEMLAVEKELARVQSQVESLQGRLDRLESQVSMSTVTLTLEPARILGPLGYIGYGIYWVIEKLFVIR